MNINEVISTIRGLLHGKSAPISIPRTTEVVVRYLDEEFPIDCIKVEHFLGNETEPARTVMAIRIEPTE